MKILAIETSCDETAIAIIEIKGSNKKPRLSILSNIVSSQIKLHAKFGGVVPNLAKREHQKNLVPILLRALAEAKFYKKYSSSKVEKIHKEGSRQARTIKEIEKILAREQDLLKHFKKIYGVAVPDIDAIAVTYGPGLAPALWVGLNFAKALAHLWKKPLIPVNHMAGHIYSSFLDTEKQIRIPKFPALALLVSGGHTELVLMRGHGKYKILGETVDDAAGEAFDKTARILGLPYPGGPEISKYAEKPSALKIALPRPMLNSKNLDFSFSGLKTAALYKLQEMRKRHSLEKLRPAISREFENAVVDVLLKKTLAAAENTKAKTILLGGGVAANKKLRKKLSEALQKQKKEYFLPQPWITGDNALMIAFAAHFQWASLAPKERAAFLIKKKKAWNKVQVDANLRLS